MTHQSLNIDYLVKQNRKLCMQLKQTQQIKQLHQQALIQMNQQYAQSQIIQTLISIINHTSKRSQTNQLNDYIMQLQGKVMVLQKISQQTQQSQKQTYYLLAQQFQKLKQQNIRISDQLHKFYQKIGQVDYISGLVTKYKQIITTTDQAMAFKKQQELLLDALNLQQETIRKLTNEREKLIKINVYMKEQVERKKEQLRNMTVLLVEGRDGDEDRSGGQHDNNVLADLEDNQNHNSSSAEHIQPHIYAPNSERSTISMSRLSKLNLTKMNNSQQNLNTTLNFIKMQRQLLKDVKEQCDSSFTNQSQLDCPQLSILFPDKVQKIIRTKQQAKVPYLNMKKVREMMAKRQQKMRKQWQQQKIHINPTTKIIQLETELDITRKELSNQSLKFRLMEDEIKTIRLKFQQLQRRNQLLTDSNSKLRTNYQANYKDYQLCKSIAMQVERALGMTLGKDNQRKVRQRLGMILGDKKDQNSKKKGQNIGKDQNNQLQSTFKNQVYAKRLYDVFQCKGLRMSEHRRCYST